MEKNRLGTEVTTELVRKEKPDAVVLATSSSYHIPQIPDINRRNVFTIKGLAKLAEIPLRLLGPQALHKLSKFFLPFGKRVVVLGGQIEGT